MKLKFTPMLLQNQNMKHVKDFLIILKYIIPQREVKKYLYA